MESNTKIKALKSVFPDIVFKLRSKIKQEVVDIIESQSRGLDASDLNFYTLKYLESELNKAIKALVKIKNQFKKGYATIEQVQDFELNVIELEDQIESVKGNMC